MFIINGITGFSSCGSSISTVNKEDFKSACYVISNKGKFKVLSFDFDLNGKNFYTVEVELDQQRIFALLNAYYPIIAFASEVSPYNITYRDDLLLEREFRSFFNVLSQSELNTPISSKEIEQLDSAELKQLEYYNPKNIGEVIFNFWD